MKKILYIALILLAVSSTISHTFGQNENKTDMPSIKGVESSSENDKKQTTTWSTSEQEDKDFPYWLLILGAGGGGFFALTRYKNRCYSCKKWNARQKINEELSGATPTTIEVKDREVKNGKGEVIKTYYKTVPATTWHYLVTEKCKYCGHQTNYTKSVTK